ncbi:hypothetical protein HanPI659440_Chr06g0229881 [Helianthus annuus]|nr:hypothetical protein HanPI659440_Chr06g0229881 [Helianthus annuus]
MVPSESDSKINLIKQICDISNHANSCVHHDTFDSGPFIDWYILLQLEDNVNLDTIRKRYHKYGMLLSFYIRSYLKLCKSVVLALTTP